MGFGLILGDVINPSVVILGLAFLAQTFTTAFLVIEILGPLCLGSIAWKPGPSGPVAE